MYLSVLDLETKYLFLDLELYISKTDGEFNDLEKQIIDTHCIEMHIDNNNYQCELPLSVVYEKLGKCTEEEKRIIFIEMLAVVLADKVYHQSEKILVDRLANILKIKDEDVKKAFAAVEEMKEAYVKFSNFVFNRE